MFLFFAFTLHAEKFSYYRNGIKILDLTRDFREERYESRTCRLFILTFSEKKGEEESIHEDTYYEYTDSNLNPVAILKKSKINGELIENLEIKFQAGAAVFFLDGTEFRRSGVPENFYLKFTLPELYRENKITDYEVSEFDVFDEETCRVSRMTSRKLGDRFKQGALEEFAVNYCGREQNLFFNSSRELLTLLDSDLQLIIRRMDESSEPIAPLWVQPVCSLDCSAITDCEIEVGLIEAIAPLLVNGTLTEIKNQRTYLSALNHTGRLPKKISHTISTDEISVLAGQIVKGEENPELIIARISEFCRRLKVELETGVQFRFPADVIKSGTGTRLEVALLFNALLRAVGMEAQDCVGFIYTQGFFRQDFWGRLHLGKDVLDLNYSGLQEALYFPIWEGDLTGKSGLISDLSTLNWIKQSARITQYSRSGKLIHPLDNEPIHQRIGDSFISERLNFTFSLSNSEFTDQYGEFNEIRLQILGTEKSPVEIRVSTEPVGYCSNLQEALAHHVKVLEKESRDFQFGSSAIPAHLPNFIVMNYLIGRPTERKKVFEALRLGKDNLYKIRLDTEDSVDGERYFMDILKSFEEIKS